MRYARGVRHRYGGLYLDGDTILLRDMSPLLGMEFVYNWGNDCTLANGAIMRLHAGVHHALISVN